MGRVSTSQHFPDHREQPGPRLISAGLGGGKCASDLASGARAGRGHPGSGVLYIGSLLLITRQTNLFIFAHVSVDVVVSEIGFWLLEA